MRGPTGRFVMHYVEMLVAMFAGMLVLWMPLVALGPPDATELELIGMAFTMTVPMVAWMRYRGHGWAPAWEMTAAMFPAMLVAMLLRRSEYTGHAMAH